MGKTWGKRLKNEQVFPEKCLKNHGNCPKNKVSLLQGEQKVKKGRRVEGRENKAFCHESNGAVCCQVAPA